jgi:outer membrane protein TolC/ABC-type transporter MlaC component
MTIVRPVLPLLVLWTLIAPPTAGARTLDRRSAIRIALQQNPQIAAARAEEAVVRAQGRQADAARWPIVGLTAGVGPSLQATLVPGTAVQSVEQQYHNLSLSDLSVVLLGDLAVTQPLYTFGKIAKRQEAAAHGVRAREAQTRMKRADVAFEVAQIYEGYLYARDAGLSFEETVHWLDRTLESAEERLSKGAKGVSERDVLRLQSGKALAQMGVNLARASMAEATAGLAAYLGFPQSETISFAETELAPVGRVPDSLGGLVAIALGNRPELTALHEGNMAYGALARAEAAGLYPDIFALGLVSVAYTPGRDWIETRFVIDPLNHFYPALLVGLRWQFQWDMAAQRAAEQQAQAEILRHTGEWADAGIPAEVRRAYEEIHRTDLNVQQGLQGVAKAKQWVVMAGADYAIGFLDVREVSDALLAYVTLRTALLQANFDHNVAMASLNKATGTLDDDSKLFYLAPPEAGQEHGGGGTGTLLLLREPRAGAAIEPAGLQLAAARRSLVAEQTAGGGGGGDKEAEATIRQTVDSAFAVLKDKALATHERRHERIAALRAIADKVFDWSEMARGSLGVRWRSLHPSERTEFVEVFKDVLAAQYIDDIDRFQGTEKVTVDGSSRQGEDVTVHTTLITASHEHVPMDYRMRQEQGRWRIVDISIEGVSLVNHFRKTFSDALANTTVQQLIERLKQQLPPK